MSLTLASAIYPGETKTIDNTLNDLNLTWSIQDNDTMINGLVVKITLEKINITFPGDMPPYSFNILFQSEEYEEEIVVPVHHSSGGGSSSYSYNFYIIDNVSGKDYGEGSNYPRYHLEKDIPEEELIINEETPFNRLQEKTNMEEISQEGGKLGITGAAIGFTKTNLGKATSIFILVLVIFGIILTLVYLGNKNRK